MFWLYLLSHMFPLLLSLYNSLSSWFWNDALESPWTLRSTFQKIIQCCSPLLSTLYELKKILTVFRLVLPYGEVSSVLAWRIPGRAEPGGLPSMGSHRVGHVWSDLAASWRSLGSPGGSVVKNLQQCRRPGFSPWIWKMPWRIACQPTLVFLPRVYHRQEEPGRLKSVGLHRVGHDWSN